MSTPSGYRGAQTEQSGATPFNAMNFLVTQILNGRNHATLVQVKAVTNAGGVAPVGFVDVLPLVNQLDGDRNAVPHGIVNSLPYFRMQGGTNAIILDPQVGDIGLAVFADRDLSSVKASKAQANPGSMRRADFADGLYVGGFLNGVPVQYVQFTPGGINVVSPTAVTITAPAINSTGAWVHTGTIVSSGDVVAGGKSLISHVHSGVMPGASNTGAPV